MKSILVTTLSRSNVQTGEENNLFKSLQSKIYIILKLITKSWKLKERKHSMLENGYQIKQTFKESEILELNSRAARIALT